MLWRINFLWYQSHSPLCSLNTKQISAFKSHTTYVKSIADTYLRHLNGTSKPLQPPAPSMSRRLILAIPCANMGDCWRRYGGASRNAQLRQKATGNETGEAKHRRNTSKHWRKTAAEFGKNAEEFAESAALSAEFPRGLHHAIAAAHGLGSMTRTKPPPNGMLRTGNTRKRCPTAASPCHSVIGTHATMTPKIRQTFGKAQRRTAFFTVFS